eukprot:732192_1
MILTHSGTVAEEPDPTTSLHGHQLPMGLDPREREVLNAVYQSAIWAPHDRSCQVASQSDKSGGIRDLRVRIFSHSQLRPELMDVLVDAISQPPDHRFTDFELRITAGNRVCDAFYFVVFSVCFVSPDVFISSILEVALLQYIYV